MANPNPVPGRALVLDARKDAISLLKLRLAMNPHHLDTTKIASDGFSCGGLMSMGTAADPCMTAVGQTSSGLTSSVASYYKSIHTPFKILVGGSGDVAYSTPRDAA